MSRNSAIGGFLMLLAAGGGREAFAQPWDFFVDPVTGQACDTVNAANLEFVVWTDTGELVIITGPDEFLLDSFVSGDGEVFIDGFSSGAIGFADDGDGLASLFWLTDFGTVVFLDPATLLPEDSGLFPEEFINVPCDACELWDDPFDCIFDEDGDGVPDDEDFCPDTPIGADVDFDGCACFEVDDDEDGIDNCDDLCPNTPFDDDVDIDGCSVNGPPAPPIFITCGSFAPLMMGLTFCGLLAMRFASRSRRY